MSVIIKTNPAYQMPFSITEFLRTSFVRFGKYLKSQRSLRVDNLEFRRLAARDDLYLHDGGLSRSDMAWAYNTHNE